MEIKELEEKVVKILEGIACEETQRGCVDGWWPTSIGAEFGRGKLNEIREAFKEYMDSEDRKVAAK